MSDPTISNPANRTCDIVYVKAHIRGFKGTPYPVNCYWRGNGSAYKGHEGGCPIAVVKNVRKGYTVKHPNGNSYGAGDVLMNGKSTAEMGLNQLIRYNCDNVPTPFVMSKEVLKAIKGAPFNEDVAIAWLSFGERDLGLLDVEKVDSFAGDKYMKRNGLFRNAVKHKTKGGSTFVVEEDNTISSVHAVKTDKEYSTRQLIEKARTAGGDRMESYADDYTFMTEAGFVPVAWTPVDPSTIPGYDPKQSFSEPIRIYYAHAEKCSKEDIDKAHGMTAKQWMQIVSPSSNGAEAKRQVADYIDGKKDIAYEDNKEARKAERRARRKQMREDYRDLRFPMAGGNYSSWGEENKPKKRRGRPTNDERERERQEREWREACAELDAWDKKMQFGEIDFDDFDDYDD